MNLIEILAMQAVINALTEIFHDFIKQCIPSLSPGWKLFTGRISVVFIGVLTAAGMVGFGITQAPSSQLALECISAVLGAMGVHGLMNTKALPDLSQGGVAK